jgi:hypothetical protein
MVNQVCFINELEINILRKESITTNLSPWRCPTADEDE